MMSTRRESTSGVTHDRAAGDGAFRPGRVRNVGRPATVPGMTLEQRVTVLEHDVAELRSQTHGWAEVAVTVANQASSAGRLLTLVYREITEVKSDVSELKRDVSDLKRDVSDLTGVVAGHTEKLNQHTETLNQHTVLLLEILARLPPGPA